MSFDIDIGNYSTNITGNLGAFFAWALHGADEDPSKRSDSRDAIFGKAHVDGLKALDGLPTGAAGPLLLAAIRRVVDADAEWLDRFNAPNGWGTWKRGLEVLRGMANACEVDGETVRVGW